MGKDTNWLTPEWLQVGLDALNETLNASPEIKRQMVEFLLESGLWKVEGGYDSALNRFNRCLNPSYRDTFFRSIEIWTLMKRFDRHEFALAMMRDLGYSCRKVPTEEREFELRERLVVAVEASHRAIAAATDEIARMQQAGVTVRPHAAFRESGGSFSHDERGSEPGGF